MNIEDPPFLCPTTIGNYEVGDLVGAGSFSFVYKAKDTISGEYVALKVIPKEKLNQKGDKTRLCREVESMKMLSHENIVALHYFFEDDDNYFLAMDYCEGGSIFDLIMAGKHLREPQVATIFRQIVEAIDFCHKKGIAHRDLKPQNVLFTSFPHIKISDFGLCGYISTDKKMSTFCGSPCYTAPECLSHIKYDGQLADIWSLGVMLFEMVTFSHPWNISNIPQMVHQITNCTYTIPPCVTSACSDLIESLLKLEGKERLTCEDILSHPWMKLAPKKVVCQKTTLPPLKKISTANDVVVEGMDININVPLVQHQQSSFACMVAPENTKIRHPLGHSKAPKPIVLLKRTSYSKHQRSELLSHAHSKRSRISHHDSLDNGITYNL